MSAFTGELTITEVDGRHGVWRLEQPLPYEVGFKGSGRWVIAPAEMTTDGATTMVFRPILPAWGTYSRAAVIHDHLCQLLRAGNHTTDLATFMENEAILGPYRVYPVHPLQYVMAGDDPADGYQNTVALCFPTQFSVDELGANITQVVFTPEI